MPKFNQYAYINQYAKENYKTFSTKISPEEFDEINEICAKLGQSKARLIVNAVRFYAENITQNNSQSNAPQVNSLTAADTATAPTAPEEISTGAEKRAETNTETPTPRATPTSPTEPQKRTQNDDKQGKPDIVSKATETLTEDARGTTEGIQIYTEADIKRAAEEAAREAYAQAYIKGRRDQRREIEIKATAKRAADAVSRSTVRANKAGKLLKIRAAGRMDKPDKIGKK